EGANLRDARMEGAVLWGARMEGANLRDARMERADLSGARMEGANLRYARMEGANLSDARMEGANLRDARMEGAVLWGADMRSVSWAAATLRGAAAQDTDLRFGIELTQPQLDQVLGNENTLLPDGLHVWTCWDPEALPPTARGTAEQGARFLFASAEDILADWTCGPGQVPEPTGVSCGIEGPERDPRCDRPGGPRD
ncbi:MAG: pentapeptide repeat-containing protein, partial [Pseudomonadota bacterium]